ncbi:recombinase family protein [Bacteroides acidifaciens]|jgi:DNA invertase Pin-like site-specific DNA recombinase|uniref:recombinase family protein n=1 Tax=Bacteroides acidifaciens TaxID=85831 RepID=UPI00242F656D|nr:recombinase family protein [Bacteroides acidifaciens]
MKKVVIFARVSSTNGTQDYERQINDLQTLASANNWTVEAVFAEKVSGAKKNIERTELMNMIDYINSHDINKVLVTELSRLGRDTLQVLQAIEILNQNKVSVFIQNYNIETLTSEGEINPMSQFLITILAEVARMERKTIRERVASGYQNFRNNGGKVGRRIGYTKSDEAMREEYAEELRLLKRGYSLRNTSKLTGTSINTLRKLTKLT